MVPRQRYTVGFGVEQLRFAAEHQAASRAGRAPDIWFSTIAHIHIGLDVAQAHRAAKLHRAAALEAQALDQPTLPLQARAQAAVVEHKADFAVAVKRIVAVERAVERRLAHAPANRRFRPQQAAAQALSDEQEIAKSIQIGRADAQSASMGASIMSLPNCWLIMRLPPTVPVARSRPRACAVDAAV